jgi:hypothetical protein
MYCITRRGARARELLHFGKRLCSAGKPGRMGRAWPRAGRRHPIDRAAAEQVALEARTRRQRGGGAAEWQVAARGQLGAAAGRRSGRRDAAKANADDLPRLHFARAQPGRRDSPCCSLIRVGANPTAQNGAAVVFWRPQQEPGGPPDNPRVVFRPCGGPAITGAGTRRSFQPCAEAGIRPSGII